MCSKLFKIVFVIILVLLTCLGIRLDLLGRKEYFNQKGSIQVHAVGNIYRCEDIQKIGLDSIGYSCGEYSIVEFRCPHVIVQIE